MTDREILTEIDTRRRAAGLRQIDLARRVGVGQSMVSMWLAGRHTISARDLARLLAVVDRELRTGPRR